jgi:hypothetical protein
MFFNVIPAGVSDLFDSIEGSLQVPFRLEEREVALGSNLILMRFDTKQQSTLARRDGTTIFFEVITTCRLDLAGRFRKSRFQGALRFRGSHTRQRQGGKYNCRMKSA